MAEIKLIEFGKFFSGRTHAEEIVKHSLGEEKSKIIVDFSGVESFSQSFISELFYQIRKNESASTEIELINFENDNLESRAKAELSRIQLLSL